MSAMDYNLSLRRQALVTVALMLDGPVEAAALLTMLPSPERELAIAQLERYSKLPFANQQTTLVSRLQILRGDTLHRQITDIHPSHIAQVLVTEPIAIIQVILHHLPAELATEIKKFLPETTVHQLVANPELPQLHPEMLAAIRQAFIRQFTLILPSKNLFTRLTATKLRVLLRHLSLQVIAIAMRRLNRQEIVDSLQRFPRSFSKEVLRYLRLLRDIEPNEVKLAERSIVWLTGQQLKNFSLIYDLGLMLLVTGLCAEPQNIQQFITQKLSLSEKNRFYDIQARFSPAEADLLAFGQRLVPQQLKEILTSRQPLIPTTNPAIKNTPAALS
jgi:hypothetical protein